MWTTTNIPNSLTPVVTYVPVMKVCQLTFNLSLKEQRVNDGKSFKEGKEEKKKKTLERKVVLKKWHIHAENWVSE